MDFELFPNEREIELMNKEFSKILTRNAIIKQKNSNTVQLSNGNNNMSDPFISKNDDKSLIFDDIESTSAQQTDAVKNHKVNNHYFNDNQKINDNSEAKSYNQNYSSKENPNSKFFNNTVSSNELNNNDLSVCKKLNMQENNAHHIQDYVSTQPSKASDGQQMLKESILLSNNIVKMLEILYSYSANYSMKNDITEIILAKRKNMDNLKNISVTKIRSIDNTEIQTCKSNFKDILCRILNKQRILLKNLDILNNQNIDNDLLKIINLSELRLTLELKLF